MKIRFIQLTGKPIYSQYIIKLKFMPVFKALISRTGDILAITEDTLVAMNGSNIKLIAGEKYPDIVYVDAEDKDFAAILVRDLLLKWKENTGEDTGNR